MLASDVANRQFSGAADPDAVMIARFYVRAVQNRFKSKAEGRPVFENKIYCDYYPAGNNLLRMDIPARDEHKARFARQWAFFQNNQSADAGAFGTPLSAWPLLTPADVENLKAAKFLTIDNIAAASDQQLQSLGMGAAGMSPDVLRARAQAFLQVAKDTSLPQHQAEQIEALKKAQDETNAKHAAEMAELRAMLTKQPQKTKGKKGAKKKDKSERTPEQVQAAKDRMAKARAAIKNKAHA